MPQIYTLGYAAASSEGRLVQLMSDEAMVLVDIRLCARSRWYHQWAKRQLQQQWGTRYVHVPQLGNVNYRQRGQPIALRDAEAGLQVVTDLLKAGYSVVLLCACLRYERCHRKLVAEQLAASSGVVLVGEVQEEGEMHVGDTASYPGG
jgi:uncharacterized protein (DUF488 family)